MANYLDPDYVDRVRSRGVKSNVAVFTILHALSYPDNGFSWRQCTERWLAEKKTLGPLHALAQAKFAKRCDQATFFALHVLYYLQFGHRAWTDEDPPPEPGQAPSCPYTDDAVNFIVTLLQNGGCQCACYTHYVLAAAEEFGYSEVYPCSTIGHVNIVIVDPTLPVQRVARPHLDNRYRFLYPYLEPTDRPAELDLSLGQAYIDQPGIHAVLDAGFRNNSTLQLHTWDALFRERYDLHHLDRLVVTPSLANVRCTGGKSPSGHPSSLNKWSTMYAVLKRILTRKSRRLAVYDIDMVGCIWGVDFAPAKSVYENLKLLQNNTRTATGKLAATASVVALHRFVSGLKDMAEGLDSYPTPHQLQLFTGWMAYGLLRTNRSNDSAYILVPPN